MEEKQGVHDLSAELDSFDDLEKDFQTLIGGLAGDRSLEAFRAEYERIHESYLESHKKNVKLIEEVRKLNADILSNSTKVNSILKLSQDDQRTISSLRFEFEKAWKMVELSQDREAKCGDIIESLKTQVAQLNRLIDQRENSQFSQDNSLESIQSEIYALKREIDVQSTQHQSLSIDLRKTTENCEISRNTIIKLKEEHEQLLQEFEDAKQTLIQLNRENGEIQQGITDVKLARKDDVAREDAIKTGQKDAQKRILGAQASLVSENANVKQMKEQYNEAKSRLALGSGILQNRYQAGGKIMESLDALKSQLTDQESTAVILQQDIKTISAECDVSAEELAAAKQRRALVLEETAKAQEALKRLREESLKLNAEINRMESKNIGVRHQMQLSKTTMTKNTSIECNERGKEEAITGQVTTINAQMMALKGQVHQMRIKMLQLNTETEHYIETASETRSNTMLIVAETNQQVAAVKPLNRQLVDTNDHIKKQVSLSETMQQQRDLTKRQMEQWVVENASLTEESKYTLHDLQETKLQIREKDTDCVATHIKKEEADEVSEKLVVENAAIVVKSKETTQKMSEIENLLVRTRHLCDNAEADITSLHRENHAIATKTHSLGDHVQNKMYECATIREKVRVLEGMLVVMNGTYARTCAQMEESKAELTRELDKTRQLLRGRQSLHALQLENLRTSKALLQMQGKVRALEDELESPMNVHRWRFLEATNPEQMQLIRMTQALRTQLMDKIHMCERYRITKQDVQTHASRQASHIQNKTREEHTEVVQFFNQILRQKQQQLVEMDSALGGREEMVEESRESVGNVREQLRDTREEFFDQKATHVANRTTKVLDERAAQREAENLPVSTKKYIGGGFVVSASLTESTRPGLLGATRPLFVPKSNGRAQSKIAPKGWNPNRQPLRPFLPTVSDLRT